MRRVTAVLSVAAVVLWATAAFAQGKPNFAGKWTREAPAGGAAAAGGGGGGGGRGGGGGGFGMECTITQDANTLTVEYMAGQNPLKLAYKLDGSESKNSMPGRGGGAATEVTSTAKWEGSKLVITTKGANGDTVRALSMDGAKLSVETTAPGRQGGEATTTKATYTKG